MKHLIVIEGPIGAGKTSVVREICAVQRSFAAIEPDAIKRMISPRNSTEWRREVALETGCFLAGQLLERGQSVVTETHSRWPQQAETFRDVADKLAGTIFSRFLVTAPYETCLTRARERLVPDISNPIDEAMVQSYYEFQEPETYDTVYDSSLGTPRQIASGIIQITGAKVYAALQAVKQAERDGRKCVE